MKPFRTIVTPEKPPFTVNHTDRLVSIGSCFSENIGRKFGEYKFAVNINPFGQQYNPHSIAVAIERLLNPVPYTESDLVYHDELYHSFDHHGSFSRSTTEETLQVINDNLLRAAEDLKNATVLFLTFGTSHVFELKRDESGGRGTKENSDGLLRGGPPHRGLGGGSPFRGVGGSEASIVSNCHKLSGTFFEKRLMKPDEIVAVLGTALTKLQTINPKLKTVLTVSPVRYFAFGHYENSVSKAHLFTAVYELQQRNPAYYYFPAYELVMDDLRDYRFFAEDMLHPNYQATDYVWEKLSSALIAPDAVKVMKETEELLLAARHKPRNPASEAHKKFVAKNLEKMEKLEKQFNLNFEEEKKAIRRFG